MRFFHYHISGFSHIWCRLYFYTFAFTVMAPYSACKKLIEVGPPVTGITGATVFNENATAIAAVTDIYTRTSELNEELGFTGNAGFTSLSLFGGLSADEITLFNLNDNALFGYYSNDLSSDVTSNAWRSIYEIVFVCNSAIEGLQKSSLLTQNVKQQLLGEVYFMRAFCYFYLTNFYGDVPLVLSTDYKSGALLGNAPQSDVYNQIIQDLIEAEERLSPDFLDASLRNITTERVRPTKYAASALLARTYLYMHDWNNAERKASYVIDASSTFSLVPLSDVFTKNSLETIWALQPVGSGESSNTGEGKIFILPEGGPDDFLNPVYLSEHVINEFEPDDDRKSTWTGNVVAGTDTFYFPFKYKIGRTENETVEYIMVIRLAELYLIRSEARTHLGLLADAAKDLDAIRMRAGLINTSAATQEEMITAIMHERKVELFTEWGHRWLDLKRWSVVDEVMGSITSAKGGTWESTDALYPIPEKDIEANPNLRQNSGY